MKTITREEFEKATFATLKDVSDMAAKKNDLKNGIVLQLAGATILALMERKLFDEED